MGDARKSMGTRERFMEVYGSPRKTHGSLRETHGRPMGRSSKSIGSHGRPMGDPWESICWSWVTHGRPWVDRNSLGVKISPKVSRGSPMVRTWVSHESPVGLPWIFMDVPWTYMGLVVSHGPQADFHRSPMSFHGYLVVSHTSSIGFSWVSHVSPMGLPWASHGFPWVSGGFPMGLPWMPVG